MQAAITVTSLRPIIALLVMLSCHRDMVFANSERAQQRILGIGSGRQSCRIPWGRRSCPWALRANLGVKRLVEKLEIELS